MKAMIEEKAPIDLQARMVKLLLEKSQVSLPKSPSNPNAASNDDTFEMVLDALEYCVAPSEETRAPGNPNFCASVASPAEVFRKVVQNGNIGKELRDKAAALLAAHP